MVKRNKVIFWDFDGTLVPFTSWRMALMDVLDECESGHAIDPEEIRPFLRDGFPWHRPEEPHTHLSNPDDWWQALEPVFSRSYRGVGFTNERAEELARQVRKHMIDPGRYVLYVDTVPVLAELREKGWKHVILSNHMPELPDVIKALGLSRYVDHCVTSGITGYEKPNPEAFKNALAMANNPEIAWMVGDNISADIKGAEAAGIPAILVRNPQVEDVKYGVKNLFEAAIIIKENSI